MVQHAERTCSEERQQPQRLWSPRLVYVRATIQGIDPAIIPFAVLKENPLPTFKRSQEQSLFPYETSALAIENICAAWNETFAGLSNEQLFFVCAWHSVPIASPRVVALAGLSFVIATPGPHRQRWLTTRPVWREGELVAWCEAIDMRYTERPEISEIVLSEERMLRLAKMEQLPTHQGDRKGAPLPWTIGLDSSSS